MTELTIWQPIETIPNDGRQVLIAYRGGMCIAPAKKMYEPSRREKATLAEGGYWPNADFIPTHWTELPKHPSEYSSTKE